MKRSEMVTLISDYLNDITVSNEYHAKNILRLVEEKGMLPPEACILQNFSLEYNKATPHYLETYANEWEDEETKNESGAV